MPNTITAVSTHSRIDWADPTTNTNVQADLPICVLRDADGKWVAVEGCDVDTIAESLTLVQAMASMNLKRECQVWALWAGDRLAGLWDYVPERMPLYRVVSSVTA